MPTRSSYSQSPYPTGRAPLAFDLSQQMWNIAQQRIQLRKQEIEEQQKEISENEALLITALDFETVKGAQDKFALDMAQRIDSMISKWSERMNNKEGILDTNDKLELLRDKRAIEEKIQVGAADVAQFQQLQKDLTDKTKRGVYNVPVTSANMAKYALENRIGTGGAINLPSYLPQAWGQDFMALAEQDAQKKLLDPRAWDDVPIGVDEYGNTKFQKSNKKIVDAEVEALKLTPEWQELYEENPYNADVLLESFRRKYTREPVRSVPKVKTSGTTGGGKTPSQIRADQEKQEKFSGFNTMALNLMNRDQATVQSIKNTGFGKIVGINYTKEPDGEYMHIHFQPTSAEDQRPSERIKLPKDENDTEGIKVFYHRLWNVLPAEYKKGIEFDDIPKLIKPRIGKYEGTQEPYFAEKKVEEVLDKAIKEPNRTVFQQAADTIRKYIPGFKIRANQDGFDLGDDEGGGFKRFNFKTKGKNTENTPEALKEKVMSKLKPEEKKSEGDIDIYFSDEDVKNAKDEITKKGMSKEQVVSYYYNQAIGAGANITRERVEQILKEYKIIE